VRDDPEARALLDRIEVNVVPGAAGPARGLRASIRSWSPPESWRHSLFRHMAT